MLWVGDGHLAALYNAFRSLTVGGTTTDFIRADTLVNSWTLAPMTPAQITACETSSGASSGDANVPCPPAARSSTLWWEDNTHHQLHNMKWVEALHARAASLKTLVISVGAEWWQQYNYPSSAPSCHNDAAGVGLATAHLPMTSLSNVNHVHESLWRSCDVFEVKYHAMAANVATYISSVSAFKGKVRVLSVREAELVKFVRVGPPCARSVSLCASMPPAHAPCRCVHAPCTPAVRCVHVPCTLSVHTCTVCCASLLRPSHNCLCGPGVVYLLHSCGLYVWAVRVSLALLTVILSVGCCVVCVCASAQVIFVTSPNGVKACDASTAPVGASTTATPSEAARVESDVTKRAFWFWGNPQGGVLSPKAKPPERHTFGTLRTAEHAWSSAFQKCALECEPSPMYPLYVTHVPDVSCV